MVTLQLHMFKLSMFAFLNLRPRVLTAVSKTASSGNALGNTLGPLSSCVVTCGGLVGGPGGHTVGWGLGWGGGLRGDLGGGIGANARSRLACGGDWGGAAAKFTAGLGNRDGAVDDGRGAVKY
jgi:hypothetical protein